MEEEEVGRVTHYFSKIGVAVVEMKGGSIKIGDRIHIKGHTTDFEQEVTSMQIEHKQIEEAREGETIGLKVNEHVRKHDLVYKILSD